MRVLVAILALLLTTTQLMAWCEEDCVGLCNATARKAYLGSAARCINQFRCSQYAGQQCEPDRMASRAKEMNAAPHVNTGAHDKSCTPCDDRCNECGEVARCAELCKSVGNPLVAADATCRTRYRLCGQ